jgi:NAD(P)-dependent dehydrogenase (short-subunit alcohol dehydrogenase family)
MLISYKGKTVIVTGAAQGIGKNIATKFAESGADVVVVDKNTKDGKSVVDEICSSGYKAEYYKLDLADIKQSEEMITSLFNKHKYIDVLVNNARAGKRTEPLKETIENWQLTTDVSLKAPLFLSQSFISAINGKNKGVSIINISSVASTTICQESASYHLSKSAIENLTRYLAVFGGSKGVRVNAIKPGFIVQDRHQKKYRSEDNISYRNMAEHCHPLREVGASDDVANAVLFLCSEYAAFITGQVLTVDGGLTIQDQWDLVNRYSNKF